MWHCVDRMLVGPKRRPLRCIYTLVAYMQQKCKLCITLYDSWRQLCNNHIMCGACQASAGKSIFQNTYHPNLKLDMFAISGRANPCSGLDLYLKLNPWQPKGTHTAWKWFSIWLLFWHISVWVETSLGKYTIPSIKEGNNYAKLFKLWKRLRIEWNAYHVYSDTVLTGPYAQVKLPWSQP